MFRHTLLTQIFLLLNSIAGIAQYNSASIPAGQLIDSVYVNNSTDESFALYLPAIYDKTKEWPVVFFFDPAARGSFTLLKYKNIAERYGLIMVCSNNCRNGQIPVMEKLAKNMFETVFGQFKIDHEHIYLSGFSGGARLSISLIQNLPFNVRAVIGCGAGFPANRSIDTDFPFAYVTLTGTRDGNFNELYSNKSFFDNNGMNHPMFLFEGGHTWPPEEHFEEAVLWLLINDNMLDNNTVEKIYVDISERIKRTMLASDYLQAYYLADAFSKLPVENHKHNILHSLYQEIISNPGYLQEYQELNKVLKKEREMQTGFNSAFLAVWKEKYGTVDTIYTTSWWKAEYQRVKRFMQSASLQKKNAGLRLQNFIAVGAYEIGHSYLNNKDYQSAQKIFQIYILFIPDHYYGYVQLARTYAAGDKKKYALKYLKKAIDCGLDIKIIPDMYPEFSTFLNDKHFQSLIR